MTAMAIVNGLYSRQFVIVIIICFQVVTCQKYVISMEAVNWYQALINCKNAGMELASIHSEEEHNELESFLKKNGHEKGYWLAGNNEGNGQYYWATTGLKTIYTHWLTSQPDNGQYDDYVKDGEHCIQWGMGNRSPEPVGWNDVTCTTILPYICQRFEYCYDEL